MVQRLLRLLACCGGVAAVTAATHRIIPVNATTAGFAFLLLVLVIASTWGFLEAALTSVAATLAFNFYFMPPIGNFTIADPQNWAALFSFLATSLIASRLSTKAKRRALDALERQRDLERLYSFSRAILLSGGDEPFPKQLIRKLAETFDFKAAVLYDRRAGEFHRAGPAEFAGLDDQLREAALHGTSFCGPSAMVLITAVRLGSEPIGSLGVQGIPLPDSVLQGIANLVAIGLERAQAQTLAHQVEAARQSEQLRTTLIDAMAHEFKTPLTVIKGVTSSMLYERDTLPDSAREQLTIADEEAEHLRELVDNAIEMARLDTTHIDVHREPTHLQEIVQDVVSSMQTAIEKRPFDIEPDGAIPVATLDRRLIRLALKQLLDNALKYSPPDSPVAMRLHANGDSVWVDVVDHGPGIAPEDTKRIFERFYRGKAVKNQIPGSGLGLTIANSIAKAHHGELSVSSRPGETVFRMRLPVSKGAAAI